MYGRGQKGLKKVFTITERHLARWLFESCVQQGCRPWKWRDGGTICFSLSRAIYRKILNRNGNNKSTIISMVCTLSDHRNVQEMAQMFITLQRNNSPAARVYTWVLNILTSFLWSITVQIMENCCRFVSRLIRTDQAREKTRSTRGVALLPPTRLRGWSRIEKKNDRKVVNWRLTKSFASIYKNTRGIEQLLRTDFFLSLVSFVLDGDEQESLKRKRLRVLNFQNKHFLFIRMLAPSYGLLSVLYVFANNYYSLIKANNYKEATHWVPVFPGLLGQGISVTYPTRTNKQLSIY